jgi:hypothetical protein
MAEDSPGSQGLCKISSKTGRVISKKISRDLGRVKSFATILGEYSKVQTVSKIGIVKVPRLANGNHRLEVAILIRFKLAPDDLYIIFVRKTDLARRIPRFPAQFFSVL